MGESAERWDEVGQRFTALGRRFKEHYAERSTPAGEAESGGTPPGATEPGGTPLGATETGEPSPGATGEPPPGTAQTRNREVSAALRNLTDAVDRVLTSVGDGIRDPGVQQEARQAVGTLGDALASTFGELGNELRGATRRWRGGGRDQGPTDAATPDAPPADGSGTGAPEGPLTGPSTTDAGTPEATPLPGPPAGDEPDEAAPPS